MRNAMRGVWHEPGQHALDKHGKMWFIQSMSYTLPNPVKWALNRLTSCSYEAYAVGGCVRDMLLQRVPHDWDVCTSASPQQVIDCFADVRVVATGLRHGTVTALLDGQQVEITTYRVDGDYADHRHPDQVHFTTSLREDLARRDFTINAMAYRPDKGIIDYYGGREDLDQGIIRCVGNPDERFSEDALRILRALRFASRFAFEIEPETEAALLRHREELRYVSVERVLTELAGTDFSKVKERYLPVVQVVIPELMHIDVRPGLPVEPAIRLAALLKGLDAGAILKRLKASTALTERVAAIVSELDTMVGADDVSLRQLLRHIGPSAAEQLLVIQDNPQAIEALRRILRRGDAYTLRQLEVTGKDLLKLGLSGPQIGRALDGLLTKVIEGELPNEHYKLMRAVGAFSALAEVSATGEGNG